MDEFLGFIVVHLPVYLSAFEGFLTVLILWHIEKDLEILIRQRSSLDDEIQKISISLMGSLNEVRKLVRDRPGRKRDQ